MKNLLLQARIVTDPIKNPLIGWWMEYYIFYVKHRDLVDRDELTQMMIDPTFDVTTIDQEADEAALFFQGDVGNVPWAKKCLRRITEEYFRDEGVTWNGNAINGIPLATISGNSFLDSAMLDTDYDDPDIDVDLDADANIMASEVETAMAQYNLLRYNNLTTQTYEEFLQTYGVRPQKEETHKPELLRFIREWTYPSNTIDPSSGAPSSACSWSIAERADKDRFFREPGFIFGVSVARPKVYLSGHKGSITSLMNDPYAWMPAVLGDNHGTSMKKVEASGTPDGPLSNVITDYWIDLKDLFIYGEQFCNFALTATDAGMIDLPTSTMEKRFATETDIKALFVTGATDYFVKQDGIVSLNVLSGLSDTTPTITHAV